MASSSKDLLDSFKPVFVFSNATVNNLNRLQTHADKKLQSEVVTTPNPIWPPYKLNLSQRKYREATLTPGNSIQSHINNVPLTQGPQCQIICDYSSVTKNITIHIRSRKSSRIPFFCHLCSYQTMRNVRLQAHLYTHTGETPFECPQCNFRTAYKESLPDHMLTHTAQERQFKCDKCTFSATISGNLTRHRRKQHK